MKNYLYSLLSSAGSLSTEDILLRILISVGFGIVIYISYRITHPGSVYSKKFNITLLILTILTTTVMTVIGNNIALSLGMVGALSIVRFRTSIKDSRDTVYIFWTIIIGICCGVGDFTVAAVGSAVVFVVLLIFGQVKDENRLLLIIRADRHISNDLRRMVFSYFLQPPVVKVENTTPQKVELIFELSRRMLKKAQKKEKSAAAAANREARSLLDQLYDLNGVDYANLVSQRDEIT